MKIFSAKSYVTSNNIGDIRFFNLSERVGSAAAAAAEAAAAAAAARVIAIGCAPLAAHAATCFPIRSTHAASS